MKTLFFTLALILTVAINVMLYVQGMRDGEQKYKHSIHIYYALKSAYHYGYMDCSEKRCESWEGDCGE